MNGRSRPKGAAPKTLAEVSNSLTEAVGIGAQVRPNSAARDGQPREQLTLDLSGRDAAEANADAWWWSSAMQAIEELARTGDLFEAYDLVDQLGLREPDHANRWGALFSAAAKAGIVVAVGAKPSRRPSGAGHLTRTWRGAR